jgi:hypothetical protein
VVLAGQEVPEVPVVSGGRVAQAGRAPFCVGSRAVSYASDLFFFAFLHWAQRATAAARALWLLCSGVVLRIRALTAFLAMATACGSLRRRVMPSLYHEMPPACIYADRMA